MGGCTSAPLGPRSTTTKRSPAAASNVATLAADISTPMVSVPPPAIAPSAIPVVTPVVVTVVSPAEEDAIVPPAHSPPPAAQDEEQDQPKAKIELASSLLEEKSNGEEEGEVVLLKTLVVMGSGRKTPSRMGDRVGAFLVEQLKSRTGAVRHEVDYIDVAQLDLPFLETPQYHYPAGTAPAHLEALAARVHQADCLVFISPEYNHSMSPALANFVAHFSQQAYALKPSAIAVYSMGPFGGVRAAMQLRALTGECGCDAVNAIFAAPTVQLSLDEQGLPLGENGARLVAQAAKVLGQLEWYAEAYKAQRAKKSVPATQ